MRNCTGHRCENRCKDVYYFCLVCFGRLTQDIKTDLIKVRKHGSGVLTIETLKKARAHLEIRNEKKDTTKMSKSNSKIIDVDLDLVDDSREKSFVVSNGETNPETGNKIWIFLPKSLVEDNGDGTFAIPYWLAEEKGLI